MSPPDNLPPLPPGSRYAGRLKDHTGILNGWVITDFGTGWTYGPWEGRADRPSHYSAVWHVALPVESGPRVPESDTPETDAALRPRPATTWQNYGDSNPETVLAEFARGLERRLCDTEKLLAQYSAEREHNAMMAGAYKAERDALIGCLAHLRDKDWFKDAQEIGSVACLLPADATRKALSNLTP